MQRVHEYITFYYYPPRTPRPPNLAPEKNEEQSLTTTGPLPRPSCKGADELLKPRLRRDRERTGGREREVRTSFLDSGSQTGQITDQGGREGRREGERGRKGPTRGHREELRSRCPRCYLTDASQRLGLRFRKRHTTGREEGKISALKKPVRATNEDGRREKRDTDVDETRFSKKQN